MSFNCKLSLVTEYSTSNESNILITQYIFSFPLLFLFLLSVLRNVLFYPHSSHQNSHLIPLNPADNSIPTHFPSQTSIPTQFQPTSTDTKQILSARGPDSETPSGVSRSATNFNSIRWFCWGYHRNMCKCRCCGAPAAAATESSQTVEEIWTTSLQNDNMRNSATREVNLLGYTQLPAIIESELNLTKP